MFSKEIAQYINYQTLNTQPHSTSGVFVKCLGVKDGEIAKFRFLRKRAVWIWWRIFVSDAKDPWWFIFCIVKFKTNVDDDHLCLNWITGNYLLHISPFWRNSVVISVIITVCYHWNESRRFINSNQTALVKVQMDKFPRLGFPYCDNKVESELWANHWLNGVNERCSFLWKYPDIWVHLFFLEIWLYIVVWYCHFCTF